VSTFKTYTTYVDVCPTTVSILENCRSGSYRDEEFVIFTSEITIGLVNFANKLIFLQNYVVIII